MKEMKNKASSYPTKYKEYLISIYKEIFKINCAVCDIKNYKNFVYDYSEDP